MPRFAIVSILSCLLLTYAHAQDASTGSVRGTVTDSASARIPAATIALVNIATGIRYFATTDAEGRFALALLPPGDYLARAEAPGMSPQITPGLHLELGGTTEVEFKLAVAGVKEIVSVTSAPQRAETQPAELSSVIDERAIQELPLNGRRFTDLALLTPGVTQDPARPAHRLERRPRIRRHPRLSDQLSGRWRRRQQRLLLASVGRLSRPLSILKRSGAGISASRAAPPALKADAPAARSSTSSPNPDPINSTARSFTTDAIARSTLARLCSPPSQLRSKINSASPSAARSNATAPSSWPASTSTSSTFPRWCNSTTEVLS